MIVLTFIFLTTSSFAGSCYDDVKKFTFDKNAVQEFYRGAKEELEREGYPKLSHKENVEKAEHLLKVFYGEKIDNKKYSYFIKKVFPDQAYRFKRKVNYKDYFSLIRNEFKNRNLPKKNNIEKNRSEAFSFLENIFGEDVYKASAHMKLLDSLFGEHSGLFRIEKFYENPYVKDLIIEELNKVHVPSKHKYGENRKDFQKVLAKIRGRELTQRDVYKAIDYFFPGQRELFPRSNKKPVSRQSSLAIDEIEKVFLELYHRGVSINYLSLYANSDLVEQVIKRLTDKDVKVSIVHSLLQKYGGIKKFREFLEVEDEVLESITNFEIESLMALYQEMNFKIDYYSFYFGNSAELVELAHYFLGKHIPSSQLYKLIRGYKGYGKNPYLIGNDIEMINSKMDSLLKSGENDVEEYFRILREFKIIGSVNSLKRYISEFGDTFLKKRFFSTSFEGIKDLILKEYKNLGYPILDPRRSNENLSVLMRTVVKHRPLTDINGVRRFLVKHTDFDKELFAYKRSNQEKYFGSVENPKIVVVELLNSISSRGVPYYGPLKNLRILKEELEKRGIHLSNIEAKKFIKNYSGLETGYFNKNGFRRNVGPLIKSRVLDFLEKNQYMLLDPKEAGKLLIQYLEDLNDNASIGRFSMYFWVKSLGLEPVDFGIPNYIVSEGERLNVLFQRYRSGDHKYGYTEQDDILRIEAVGDSLEDVVLHGEKLSAKEILDSFNVTNVDLEVLITLMVDKKISNSEVLATEFSTLANGDFHSTIKMLASNRELFEFVVNQLETTMD